MKVIPASIANPFIRAHHYSGGVVTNSCLHFGVFLDGQLHGVMSYGPSMNKQKMIGLVEGTGWNEFLELNRMAFDKMCIRDSHFPLLHRRRRRPGNVQRVCGWIGLGSKTRRRMLRFSIGERQVAIRRRQRRVGFYSRAAG